jgi:hypothetical protein
MFWGLDSTGWTAVGALAGWVYCGLTAGLLAFAIYQVRAVKEEARITRTLAACDRYDTDPILDRVTGRIAEALDNGTLAKTPKDFSLDMKILFNYFESIAIGVSRNLYDKDIVREQLNPILVDHVNDLIESGISSGVSGWENVRQEYDHTMKLYGEWLRK